MCQVLDKNRGHPIITLKIIGRIYYTTINFPCMGIRIGNIWSFESRMIFCIYSEVSQETGTDRISNALIHLDSGRINIKSHSHGL